MLDGAFQSPESPSTPGVAPQEFLCCWKELWPDEDLSKEDFVESYSFPRAGKSVARSHTLGAEGFQALVGQTGGGVRSAERGQRSGG